MKPKDLKCPFVWAERRVEICDRVWYVPPNTEGYELFHFPGWDHPSLFGNTNPITVEYCSGNGKWVVERALANPHQNWVAVEMQFDRVRKIWSKIKNHGIDNLVVLCAEAYAATQWYFPDNSISDIYINFPDPWPKARHAKHRLIQPRFVREMWRILEGDGTVTFVTDDADYSVTTIHEMLADGGYASVVPEPYYKTNDESYGDSYFDALWRSKGKTIRYHQFRRKEREPYCAR